MESAIAFGIFIAIIGYFITRSEDKEKVQAVQTAYDEISKVREDTKAAIHVRAVNFGVDYTDDELEWICHQVEAEFGKEGLLKVIERFREAGDKGNRETIRKQFESLKYDYQLFLQDLETKRLEDEADRKWQLILGDFKRLNPAQQKKQLAFINKNRDANGLSDEQLHILELVSLNEPKGSKETDIMIGDMKLFSVRKK